MYHKPSNIIIVLQGTSIVAKQRAEQIAASIKASVTLDDSPDQLRLVVADARIVLRGPEAMSLGSVCVDFSKVDLRSGSRNLSRKQPLGRAIGRRATSIVDATAGMGQDAFLLACMGYQVLAFERSPIIAALLEDGLRRAMEDALMQQALAGRLTFMHGDARLALPSLEKRPDVVYMDPMFPPKRRVSALPKKEIQLLRLVVGDDPDMQDLLTVARQVAMQRVVLKRPTHASPLNHPTMSIESKLVRYDVYVRQGQPVQ